MLAGLCPCLRCGVARRGVGGYTTIHYTPAANQLQTGERVKNQTKQQTLC